MHKTSGSACLRKLWSSPLVVTELSPFTFQEKRRTLSPVNCVVVQVAILGSNATVEGVSEALPSLFFYSRLNLLKIPS